MIDTGATPGQFFSFLAAFLLAYEPAKRLARLNIDLNSGLVGVRMLFEIIDSPPTEPPDDEQAAAASSSTARVEFADVQLRLSAGRAGAARHVLRRRARQGDRAGRPIRRRQVDGAQPDPALLRGRTAARSPSTGRTSRTVSRRSLRRQIAYVGQDVFLFRGIGPRQHRATASPARPRPRSSRPPRPRMRTTSSWRFPHGYDTPVGEHGLQLSGGAAPAHRDRARADQGCADHPARRGDRFARFRIRAAGAGGDRASSARAAPRS